MTTTKARTTAIKTGIASLVLAASAMAQSFGPTWTKIPRTFRGDNPASVYKASSVKKGEFETTEHFNERVAQLEGTPYVFVCPKDAFAVLYDADKQALDISIVGEVTVAKSRHNGVPYTGTNIFGVKAQIRTWSTNVYNVKSPLLGIQFINLSVPTTPEEAIRLKGNLGVLLFVKLAKRPNSSEPPFVDTDVSHYTPTSQSPYDHIDYTYTISAKAEQVLVYRQSDGLILATKPVESIYGPVAK